MKVFSIAPILFLCCLWATPNVAHAQATRTWVSGVGDDANPCSRTAPCKTFAGAISKTAAAGEINCLDPGGFGAVTITKSLAIICEIGTAGVLVSGTNGIVVNASPTDIVYLEGLDIEGLTTGLNGVDILTAAKVSIVKSKIRGFTTAGIGIYNSSSGVRVDVIDSVIADNSGEGIQSKPSGGAGNRVMIDRSRVSNNGGDGIMANGTTTTGSIKMSIRDTEAVHNTADGFVAYSAGATVEILMDGCGAFDNNRGINASGSGATASFTRCIISANSIGVNEVGVGQAISYGTNSITGNGSTGVFATTPQQ
jgi:hypothetical protein